MKLIRQYRVDKGEGFRLKHFDPDDTGTLRSKDEAADALEKGIATLAQLQDVLYAEDRWGVLLIFQAMDAAGKDGAIKHVMSGINPQGCQVYSFKAPSDEELDHDFMWRTSRCLPERGRIGIFNRSYYEETLVVRVHPEMLQRQKLPPAVVNKDIWKQRFTDIRHFEEYLWHNGIVVRKFFLNLSKKEQKRRFLARLDQSEKNWKFSPADCRERACWDDYMRAYEDMIANTATPHAPWYVVPADNKWYTRMVIAEVVVDTLKSLHLAYPKVDAAKLKQLAATRRELESGKA